MFFQDGSRQGERGGGEFVRFFLCFLGGPDFLCFFFVFSSCFLGFSLVFVVFSNCFLFFYLVFFFFGFFKLGPGRGGGGFLASFPRILTRCMFDGWMT